MKALASIVTARRGKWLVLAVWVIAFAALMPLGSKLSDETKDDTASYLPESAESTEVVHILDREFSAGETTIGLIVYQHEGGLTDADKRIIAADAKEIEAAGSEVPLTRRPAVPFTPGAPRDLVSPNGDVAYTVLTVPTDFDKSADWGKEVREITGERADGMRILLTGDLGFSADAEEVFGDLDAKLLAATVLLVLVLLGLIYRAVLVALTPLLVVFFSYTVATAFVYLYAKSGASVSSNGTTILIVLMFGVGTDYSLLLVSRYREELRRIEDKHEAMGRALRRTARRSSPAGCTVSLAMLVLALADTRLTSSLGPVAAIGVASAMVAGLTLLPGAADDLRAGRILAASRPGRVRPRAPRDRAPGSLAALRRQGPGAAASRPDRDRGGVRRRAPSGWPPTRSTTAPPTSSRSRWTASRGSTCCASRSRPGRWRRPRCWSSARGGAVTREDVATAVRRLDQVNGVARATPTGFRSNNGRTRSIDVILEGDPYKESTLDVVPRIRDSVANLGPGVQRPGRRRDRDPVRLRPSDPGRPEADRADRSGSDRDHPRGASAVAGRTRWS